MGRSLGRWVRRVRRVGAAAVTVALVTASCGGSSPSSRPTDRPTPTQTLLPASPDELPTFDVAAFRQLLAELRGKPVVVNIWASWCGPCIDEAPELARVAGDYEGRVQFVGVDIQDQIAPARAFIARFGWPYPSVFDPTGSIRDDLGLIGQPQTVFFDAQGEQVCVWSGPTSEKVLTETLDAVLDDVPGTPCPGA